MRKKKYAEGGLLQQILPSLIGMVPGGNLINAALPLLNIGNKQPDVYQPKMMTKNPFGKALGGPIVPVAQESTYVMPRPFLPSLPLQPPVDPNLQVQQMRAKNQYNPITGLGKFDANGGTGKVHSKDRFREKALGGDIVNDNFKQYSAGSHNSGNDQQIDQFGNPVSNGVASIQNKENMFNGFIYSDVLTNPETGNKFNADAMKINKKYPNARLDDISKSTLKFEMTRLQKLNQDKIDKVSTEKAYGGYIRPTATNPYLPQGVPDGDPMQAFNQADQLLQLPQVPVIPNGDPNAAFAQGQELISPLYTNLDPLPTPLQSRSTPSLTLPTFGNTTNTVDTSNTNNTQGTVSKGLGVLDAVGLGFKGAALAGSIFDALNPAEKENPILPDYQKADQYMKSANIDYSQAKQDALGVSNQQSNAIRSMSGNAGQYMSRQSGRLAQLQDAVSRISEQQSNAQSQLNVNKGQYEANKSVDNANRLTQNRINNQQNAATSRLFDRTLASDFSQIGTQFGEEARAQDAIANNRDLTNFTNSQIISALNSKYGNFQVSEDIVNQFKKGEISIDQLLKFKQ